MPYVAKHSLLFNKHVMSLIRLPVVNFPSTLCVLFLYHTRELRWPQYDFVVLVGGIHKFIEIARMLTNAPQSKPLILPAEPEKTSHF